MYLQTAFRCVLICTIVCIFHSAVRGQFIYLNNGVFKFIAGIGLPVDVDLPGGALTWFTNLQVFYKLPDNVTYYEPYKVMEKRSVKSTFNRHTIYQALAKYLTRLGISGSECIHRIICETNRRKFNSNNSLLQKIIQILFSPVSHFEQGLEGHRNAQWQGLHNSSDCRLIFKDCLVNENSIFSS